MLSELEKAQKQISKYIPNLPQKTGESTNISLESAREFADFTSIIRNIEDLQNQKSDEVIAKSLFTQMFAEFDAYIGDLLKSIYLKNNKLLKGISREISLTDLLNFEDLNSVKLSMLDKEIETFRRDSYIEQFSNLEKKFNLTLKKFKEWPKFVELSQRRNILIHNGGLVSDQYLSICEREGHKFAERPKIGDSTGVSYNYFKEANHLLSKVGLMLAYTLWSKVFPKEASEIHNSINDILFKCLQQKRWQFVSELVDFVLSENMRKDISEIDIKIRIINSSIGLKFSGRDSEAIELLNSVDWSASYRDFKLATAIISDDYNEAVRIMRSIGKNGEIINQASYHTWPLFTKFREKPDFYEAYFNVYGEEFSEKIETSEGAVEAHAKTKKIQSLIKLEKDTNDHLHIDSPTPKSTIKKKHQHCQKI